VTPSVHPIAARASEQELVATLFDLGRQVTSVLDLDELLPRIPELIARLIAYQALAVYLLDEKRGELRVGYSIGYPGDGSPRRLKLGEGLVGAAAAERRPVLVNDVLSDPRYVEAVPGMHAELVVPLVHKSKVIGALNVLSEARDQFTPLDATILRQFAAHVAVALENARLFDLERRHAEVFETLAEIGREMTSILDLDELLTRVAQLVRRVIDYRTFGILFLNDRGELESKLALQYDGRRDLPRIPLGAGLVGHAALHKEPVLVADVLEDPRYIKVVEDVRSELVIPLLLKDRCIGVFDLESPELDAFDKWHVEILTVLAAQAAVAIENARLWEKVLANEERLDRELALAQRIQVALQPTGLPKRLRGVDLAGRFEPAREVGGDFHEFLGPEPNLLIVAVGDVSGKGVPAALYGTFAGELVRSRTYRRRYVPERSSPAAVLASMNTILHERQLDGHYCALCYAAFDLKRKTVVLANSGLPFPIRCTATECAEIAIPGLPLGAFAGSRYDEVSFDLAPGDLFVFCSDGVFDAMDATGQYFGAERLMRVLEDRRGRPARALLDAIFDTVDAFRGTAPPSDDLTAVVVQITA
jgi:sigma-B regulation protein RsbU (phosphoserine phosphatase)